jgi:hypothetical protein
MNKIIGIIGAIALGLIPVYYGYILDHDEPDVRYILSDRIPLAFEKSSSTNKETVQQLDVKNIGNAAANRIIVKINGQIADQYINPYSSSDTPQIFPHLDYLEIIYDELPPKAGFSVILKVLGDGIKSSDLEIAHDMGSGQEALNKSGGAYESYLLYLFVLIYFSLSALSIRSYAIRSLSTRLSNRDAIELFKRKKPWYTRNDEWLEILSGSIREKLREDSRYSFSSVSESSIFRFLSDAPLEELPPTISTKIKDFAVNLFSDYGMLRINESSTPRDLIAFMELSCPKWLPKERWERLTDKASKHYAELIIRYKYSKDSIFELLQSEKPDCIPNETWREISKCLEERYYYKIVSDYNFLNRPASALSKAELKILSEGHQKELLQFEERVANLDSKEEQLEEIDKLLRKLLEESQIGDEKPECLKQWEWESIKRIEHRFRQIREGELKAGKILELLKMLRDRHLLGNDPPENIEQWQWGLLKDTETLLNRLDTIEAQSKGVLEDKLKLDQERRDITRIKNKIERQLSLIENVLRDPNHINRVEDYDDTFAPGNLAIIRGLANCLIAHPPED